MQTFQDEMEFLEVKILGLEDGNATALENPRNACVVAGPNHGDKINLDIYCSAKTRGVDDTWQVCNQVNRLQTSDT